MSGVLHNEGLDYVFNDLSTLRASNELSDSTLRPAVHASIVAYFASQGFNAGDPRYWQISEKGTETHRWGNHMRGGRKKPSARMIWHLARMFARSDRGSSLEGLRREGENMYWSQTTAFPGGS